MFTLLFALFDNSKQKSILKTRAASNALKRALQSGNRTELELALAKAAKAIR